MLICRSLLILLIFILSCYTVVSVSYCVNNNHKLLVAHNKQVGWPSSVSYCRSVGHLGQVCSPVCVLRPKLRGQKLCRETCPHGCGMRFVFINIVSKVSIHVYILYLYSAYVNICSFTKASSLSVSSLAVVRSHFAV